ncbi:MAG: DEAD/DEAH box helicase [Cyanobacteriota bacterium]
MDDIITKFQDLYKFPLDKFQIDAAKTLLERKSVLVTAPTGSGKTIVAEFTIFDALDKNLKVIYTAPLKALSNQKFRDLSEQYGANNVGLVTGDVSINHTAKIVVMTTEILRNILYQDIRRLDEVIYVILDECHYMNDKERGTVWEEIIIHTPKHILFVALSATVANPKEIIGWISSIHNSIELIEHDFRSVPLQHFYYTNQNVVRLLDENGNVPAKLLRNAEKDFVTMRKSKVNPIVLVDRLNEKNFLPAIYFVFSRKGCDMNLSECLNARLKLVTPEEKAEIKEFVRKIEEENPMLAETSPVTKKLLKALPEGIAVHHAGLVPIARFLVENLFQRGLIKVIFATETLAAGINMPARTTVISTLSKRGDFGHEVLSANSFTQMTGRAGRRGKDTVGYCVIVNDGREPYSEAVRLVRSSPDPIKSNFTLSYNMVLNLLKNFDYEDIKFTLKKSFGQYLANKEIIDLKVNLEKKQSSMQTSFVPCKYKPELTIDNMPLLSFEEIEKDIENQEHRISDIQHENQERHYQKMRDVLTNTKKGSILIISTQNDVNILACLVSTYRDRSNREFYAIVQSDKGVTRITPMECLYVYKDSKNIFLPDDIYADAYDIKVGSWLRDQRLKKLFDRNENKRYMRNISASNKYLNDLVEARNVSDKIRHELTKHECYSCDILNKHLNEHKDFMGIKNQISDMEETIRRRQELYLDTFNRMTEVLKCFNNVEVNAENETKPTDYGLLTSYIRAENDLAISLVIVKGVLDNLEPVECAAVISTLIFEPRRESGNDFDYIPKKIRTKIKEVYTIINEFNNIQESFGIYKPVNLETDFVEVVLKWGYGETWKNLFHGNSLDDGDIIRSFRRIIDVLHQLKNIPYILPETKNKFSYAIKSLDRDIISVNYDMEAISDAEENKDTENENVDETIKEETITEV